MADTTTTQLTSLAGNKGTNVFGIQDFSTYYTQAYNDLESYYKTILQQEGGDVDKAISRLKEDYDKGMRVAMEDYTTDIAYSRESAAAAKKEEAATAVKEGRALTGELIGRGVSAGGLAETKKEELKSAQDLRREAIDRALKKSESELGTTLERSQEDTTTTQKRGTEDVASEWQKYQTEKAMEREEKSLGLAESRYGREFNALSTKKSYELAQQGLDLQKKAMS